MILPLLRSYRGKNRPQRSSRRAPHARGEAGFSVLEALIAMAILAAAFLPLLALQSQFISSVESFERAESRIAARKSAAAHIQALNFVRAEQGEAQLGDVIMRWTARPAVPPRVSRDSSGGEGRYVMTLYQVDITLAYPDGRAETYIAKGLGWRPLYSVADSF